MRAAIDDHALHAVTELERQRAGVRVTIEAVRRRRAGIGDQNAAARGHAVESGLRQLDEVALHGAGRDGAHQGHDDGAGFVFGRIVEQREAAVRMGHQLQRAGKVADAGDQLVRQLASRQSQHVMQIEQVLQ